MQKNTKNQPKADQLKTGKAQKNVPTLRLEGFDDELVRSIAFSLVGGREEEWTMEK